MSKIDLNLNVDPLMPERKDFRIGCIGAGFIMQDCHLKSYEQAGFNPYAICSRSREKAEAAAKTYNIAKVYDTWQELLADKSVEIIDIAIPPDKQLEVVREACKYSHIKGILCQKPLAMNMDEAIEMVKLCEAAEKPLAVNSNMRYDQSMRALKTIMERGYLGNTVLATIDMRAIPHWQEFLKKYDRIEILNMGIHHIDIFRYLFGDPEKVTAVARKDPRTKFNHIDGISQYTFKYADDMMATSLDDVWAWPGEGTVKDLSIKWRVEGTDGMAKGTIGWPSYPERVPSTIKFTTRQYPDEWFEPTWNNVWFPDAFKGTMAQLLRAVESGTDPEISGRDNLKTIAAVEACYLSIEKEKTILFSDMLNLLE